MKNIVSIVTVFLTAFAFAQDLPNPIPQTPEAASFSKFQATPVSYHTGIPNISIPIYTLEGRSLSLPISISYHAGGIRVSDEASNVGLGWSLMTGGQITRSMKGMPDERFYLTTTDVKVSDFESLSNVAGDPEYYTRYQIIDRVKNGINDLEPDRFNYSFMGYSGSFMFNQNRTTESPYGEIIHMPKSDLRITPTIADKKITSWVIITPDGTKFTFSDGKERVLSSNSYVVDKAGGILNAPTTSTSVDYFSTWRISTIESHTGDIMNFEYDTVRLSSCGFGSESYNGEDSQLDIQDDYESHTIVTSQTTIESSRVTKITSSKGTVNFIYTTRNDLADVDARRLSAIEISNSSNKPIKRFEFQQSYFQSTIPEGNERIAAELISCGNGFDDNVDTKRLRLDGVKEIGLYDNINNLTSLDYDFEYSPIPLPHKKSYAQDFWGYYNGQETNTSMIPIIPVQNYPFERINFASGANRYVNSNYSQAGMLTKVTYPQGGSEEFKYENNKCSKDNIAADELAYISPPDIEKNLTLDTEVDPSYSTNDTDPNGLPIRRYRKTFEITDDILNNGELSFIVYSDVCYGANGEIIAGNSCNVTGGLRKVGNINTISFSMNQTSGTTYSTVDNVTPGTYEVFANIAATDFPANGGNLKIEVEWLCDNNQNFSQGDVDSLFLIGGLRLQERTKFDSDATPILKTNYNYNSNLTTNINVPVFAEAVEVVLTYCAAEYTADVTRFTSSPVYPLVTNQGGFVGYLEVEEEIKGYDKQSQSFETSPAIFNTYKYSPKNRESYKGSPVDYDWIRGRLEESDLNSKVTNSSTFTTSSGATEFTNNNFVEGFESRLLKAKVVFCQSGDFRLIVNSKAPEQKFVQTGGYTHLASQTETQRENNGDITIIKTFEYYAEIERPTAITTDFGDGTIHKEYFEYSNSGVTISELSSTSKDRLELENRKELIKSWKEDNNGELLNLTTINFPNTVPNSQPLLPESISTDKGKNGTINQRVDYLSYTNLGLPREVSMTNGPITSYIWGYNESYPIAKIENASYQDIATALGISLTDLKAFDEVDLSKIEGLRSSLVTAMVTTYTYDPLIGVTSITDPRGYTIYYKYDEFNRLKEVRDENDNLLSDYDYNYSTQNQE